MVCDSVALPNVQTSECGKTSKCNILKVAVVFSHYWYMQYPEVPCDASVNTVAALIIRMFKLTVLMSISISLRTKNLNKICRELFKLDF